MGEVNLIEWTRHNQFPTSCVRCWTVILTNL